VPLPLPAAPLVMVIHDNTGLVAVHGQVEEVVTFTEPVPPLAKALKVELDRV
jgi:hypothetical protein